VEKRLRRLHGKEDPSILETILRLENARRRGSVAGPISSSARRAPRNSAARDPRKISSARAPKSSRRAGAPLRLGQPRVIRIEAEAGDHRKPGRRDDAEQQRMGRLDAGQRPMALASSSGTELKNRSDTLLLEDEEVAVVGKDALEHPDRSIDDREDREHGGDPESDAGHADERAQTMSPKIDEDE
jgi:hypothetical protein